MSEGYHTWTVPRQVPHWLDHLERVIAHEHNAGPVLAKELVRFYNEMKVWIPK